MHISQHDKNMNLSKKIFFFLSTFFLYSCADYKTTKIGEKKYYSSTGFALIYDDSLYLNKVVNKKINNEDFIVVHSLLKINTPVKIINPSNSKYIETIKSIIFDNNLKEFDNIKILTSS